MNVQPAMTHYGARVRALFARPVHAGDADGPVVRLERGGQEVQLAATLAEGRLDRLAFRARGCPHLIAAAEDFCGRFEGRAVAELAGYDVPAVLRELEIPVEKTGRILLLEDAIHALAKACA